MWPLLFVCYILFFQSYYLDREAGRAPGDAVHKIYPLAHTKVTTWIKKKSLFENWFFLIFISSSSMTSIQPPGVWPASVLSSNAATSRHSSGSCCSSSSCCCRQVNYFPGQVNSCCHWIAHGWNLWSAPIFYSRVAGGGEGGGGLTPAMTLNSAAGIGVDDLRRLCILRSLFHFLSKCVFLPSEVCSLWHSLKFIGALITSAQVVFRKGLGSRLQQEVDQGDSLLDWSPFTQSPADPWWGEFLSDQS